MCLLMLFFCKFCHNLWGCYYYYLFFWCYLPSLCFVMLPIVLLIAHPIYYNNLGFNFGIPICFTGTSARIPCSAVLFAALSVNRLLMFTAVWPNRWALQRFTATSFGFCTSSGSWRMSSLCCINDSWADGSPFSFPVAPWSWITPNACLESV